MLDPTCAASCCMGEVVDVTVLLSCSCWPAAVTGKRQAMVSFCCSAQGPKSPVRCLGRDLHHAGSVDKLHGVKAPFVVKHRILPAGLQEGKFAVATQHLHAACLSPNVKANLHWDGKISPLFLLNILSTVLDLLPCFSVASACQP